MTNHELSATDFSQPTLETLADFGDLITELSAFIAATPLGVEQDQSAIKPGQVHRFVVIPSFHGAGHDYELNTSLIFETDSEGKETPRDITLSVTKDRRWYYYGQDEIYPTEPTLSIEDRSQPRLHPRSGGLVALVHAGLERSAEAHRTGASKPTEGGIKELIATTREAMQQYKD